MGAHRLETRSYFIKNSHELKGEGKMKKAVFISLAIVTICVFMGSGGGVAFAADGGAPTFMFCISHMTNAWAKEASESMQAAAKAAEVDLIVNEAAHDIGRQVSQIESGVNQKVNAIIVEPVSVAGVLPAVDAAKEAGIPVIIYNQNISDPSRASCFVGASNESLGYAEMKRAAEDLGGKGNIAFLVGPFGSEGQIGRSSGYAKVIEEYPDIKAVFESPGDWETEKGLRLAENWLQTGTQIDAFVSQNDNMALGAVKAIEDKGLSDKIKVYGIDAIPDALTAVKQGRLAITVSQETGRQSEKAIELAIKLNKGETVDKENIVDIKVIDASNVDEYLK
jgi:ribose transport system substrate-binding protein/inositol transport system substrate-binding protein